MSLLVPRLTARFALPIFSFALAAVLAAPRFLSAQTEQLGATRSEASSQRLRIDYVSYKPVQYETEGVKEFANENPNKGGIINVFFTNVSPSPLNLAFYRLNNKDRAYWRLGGSLAWDRLSTENLQPNQSGVLEMNAVTDDFSAGQPFNFAFVDRQKLGAVGKIKTVLQPDPVVISFIRVLPGLRELEVHLRNTSDTLLRPYSLEIMGRSTSNVDWSADKLNGPGRLIGRIKLAAPIRTADLIIARVGLTESPLGSEPDPSAPIRFVFSHRRCFEDAFPIGAWLKGRENLRRLRGSHIDTVVEAGNPEDDFFESDIRNYGLKVIVPVDHPRGIDTIRGLATNSGVSAWLVADEPDWNKTPEHILLDDKLVRDYNRTRPTFVTLCRNVKFFQYAPIPDIPCMDHYAVTAPSTSKWPRFYGTRLEETAYYTRDLKIASEPKPIWVWTQGIANWGQRPKRPVPTADELAAQLLLNLGRGAKGILWFSFDADIGAKFPDAEAAIRDWSRVMEMARADLLSSEPIDGAATAPDKVDAALLVGWDKAILILVNTNYEIHPEAYPWTPARDVHVELKLPEWLKPERAIELSPDGVATAEINVADGRIGLDLNELRMGRMFVLPNNAESAEAEYRKLYATARAEEEVKD